MVSREHTTHVNYGGCVRRVESPSISRMYGEVSVHKFAKRKHHGTNGIVTQTATVITAEKTLVDVVGAPRSAGGGPRIKPCFIKPRYYYIIILLYYHIMML